LHNAPHLYSSRERTALAWAEAVTRLKDQQAINGWNRFNVAFHTPAGSYKSAIGCKTG